MTAQTLLFLRSLLLGGCLMLLYDVFRILRLAVRTPSAIILAEDVAYFAVCAVASFLFMVSANFGQIRYFILLGELLGAVLCYLTLSRLIMACSKAIIAAVKAVLRFVWVVFLRPVYRLVRWFAKKFIELLNFCGALSKKSLRRANYGLKRRRVMLYNLVISKKGGKNGKGVKGHEVQKSPREEAARGR